MPPDHEAQPVLSRRALLGGSLRLTLAGGVLLGLGGAGMWLLGSRESAELHDRYRLLRKRDVVFFTALLPGCLPQATTTVQAETFLASMDSMLSPASGAMLSQIRKLVDLLMGPGTRQALTGHLSGWHELEPRQVEAILNDWRNSKRVTLNGFYATLTGLVNLAWYMVPSHQLASGYPGPPTKIAAKTDDSGD